MNTFDITAHAGIARECCVVIDDSETDKPLRGKIKYAGPIARAQLHITKGTLVLLHQDDFEKMKVIIMKGKH